MIAVVDNFEMGRALRAQSYEPRCEKTGLRGFRPGLT